MSRVALPLAERATFIWRRTCVECARCCSYVAVGVNAPTTPHLATDILWHLYHPRVVVYRDGAGHWSVLFESRCRYLGEDLRCEIYGERPHICRAFAEDTCEANSPRGGLTFTRPEDFLAYLKRRRPKLYARIASKHLPPSLSWGVLPPHPPDPPAATRE